MLEEIKERLSELVFQSGELELKIYGDRYVWEDQSHTPILVVKGDVIMYDSEKDDYYDYIKKYSSCQEHFRSKVFEREEVKFWSNGWNGRKEPKPLTKEEIEYIHDIDNPDFHVKETDNWISWEDGESWEDEDEGIKYIAPSGLICKHCGAQIGEWLSEPSEQS